MNTYPKTGIEIVPISIPSINSEIVESPTFRTDKDFSQLLGVLLVLSNEAALTGTKLGIKIDGKEITPKDFDAKLLYSKPGSVAPNELFYTHFAPLDIDESEVDIRWSDDGTNGLNRNYKADLYLLCQAK
jgi:hypothetical protein